MSPFNLKITVSEKDLLKILIQNQIEEGSLSPTCVLEVSGAYLFITNGVSSYVFILFLWHALFSKH